MQRSIDLKLGKTKIDQDSVKNGVWTEFYLATTGDTIKLKMALADASINTEYQKALRNGLSVHSRALDVYSKGSDMPPKLVKEIADIGRRVFVEQIVLGWEGMEAKDGSPLKYSADACLALFEEFPELDKQAQAQAAKVERYRVAVLDAQAGNSQPA